jgi:diacylglycerol kinase (ATP)
MKARGFSASFRSALSGVFYCLQTQRNMRIHFLAAVLVLSLGFFLRVGAYDLLFLLFAIALVFMAEMFNTVIETLVDLYTQDYHSLARVAKDVAAGVVLITALNALAVALVIFYPFIRRLWYDS